MLAVLVFISLCLVALSRRSLGSYPYCQRSALPASARAIWLRQLAKNVFHAWPRVKMPAE